jgi:hypothetical protein
MFLHYTMTDREILRSCEGCTSPHLKLVADRLRKKVDHMHQIAVLARRVEMSTSADEILETAQEIQGIAKNDGT